MKKGVIKFDISDLQSIDFEVVRHMGIFNEASPSRILRFVRKLFVILTLKCIALFFFLKQIERVTPF